MSDFVKSVEALEARRRAEETSRERASEEFGRRAELHKSWWEAGADPESIVGEDADLVIEFIRGMKRKKLPGAANLKRRTGQQKVRKPLFRKFPAHDRRGTGLTKPLMLDIYDEHRGYPIGAMGWYDRDDKLRLPAPGMVKPYNLPARTRGHSDMYGMEDQVYICDDERIRVIVSKAHLVSKLQFIPGRVIRVQPVFSPEKELLKPASGYEFQRVPLNRLLPEIAAEMLAAK